MSHFFKRVEMICEVILITIVVHTIIISDVVKESYSLQMPRSRN
jgi:hypothetical protein